MYIKQCFLNKYNVTCPKFIFYRIQLLDCLNRVLARDHPKNWPDYLSQVQMMLTSNDPSTVYIGCLALLEVVKIYQ